MIKVRYVSEGEFSMLKSKYSKTETLSIPNPKAIGGQVGSQSRHHDFEKFTRGTSTI